MSNIFYGKHVNFTFFNETSVACKWFERWHYLTSPIIHEQLEKKLNQGSTSESDYNGSRFCTPPEIYRKTSTPMFVGQKGFETPCAPNFSLKTPKTNSPSIAQNDAISQTSETQFFSFLLHASNEGMTPFRISKDEQFSRSNSGRKLSVMEEQEKIAEEVEKTTANAIEVSSPVDMDLTKPEGGILQDSPKSDDNHEDVVKKVRFSDQHKIAAENMMDSCMRTILNMSTEEEFHDANDVTNAQKAKTTEGTKDEKSTVDTSSNVKDATNASDSQVEDRRSLIQPSENILSDSQIRIIRDNTKNINKENRNPEVSNESSSTTNQRDSNRVLMMVLMESNSGRLTTDLIPLINSGLKKLQEQLTSANYQSPSSAVESAKVCRRSVTRMKMSVSSVESYSVNDAATMTNRGQLASSPSPSVRSGENNVTRNNGGFLSTITQMMRHALRNFSGR